MILSLRKENRVREGDQCICLFIKYRDGGLILSKAGEYFGDINVRDDRKVDGGGK